MSPLRRVGLALFRLFLRPPLEALLRSAMLGGFLQRRAEAYKGISIAVSHDPEAYIETTQLRIGGKVSQFYCFGALSRWRYDTIYEKEPETVAWINGFRDGEVFWDIGANIGIYTVYAAMMREGLHVIAFEPMASNYYILNKNIFLNSLQDRVLAYPVALAERTQFGLFNISINAPGHAVNHFGDREETLVCGDDERQVAFRQGMIGFAADDLIDRFGFRQPTHIKIDVDGIENLILRGAGNVLRGVESLLVEMDSADESYVAEVSAMLKSTGLLLDERLHAPMFDSGKYSSLYNYFFRRA